MSAAASVALRRPGSNRERAMITPEGLALPITVASRGARAGALIVDLAIVYGAMIATTIALLFMAGGTAAVAARLQQGSSIASALEFLFVVWIVAMFLLRNAYFLFFELGPRGATPGKRMAGIRIAARDGGRLSVDMVIARNLLRDIELFLPLVFIASASGEGRGMGMAGLAGAAWFAIFALFPFWNRDRLRAGDIVAGSWVVEVPRRKLEAVMAPTRAPERNDEPLAPSRYTFSDEELAIYGEYELQTLERVLRDNRPESLHAVHEAIARKIGREHGDDGSGDERAFLDDYYRQLRTRLETGLRMGRRKPDKHA